MIRLPRHWSDVPDILRPEDVASSLRLTLFFVLGFNVLGLMSAWQEQGSGWEAVVRNSLLLMLASGLALWLLYRNYIALATYTALLSNALVLTYAAWTGAGVNGVAYAGLILPVLATALFLGRRAGYIAAVIATLIGLGLFMAGRAGWLVNLSRPVTDVVAWLANAVFFFMAAHQISVSLAQVERALHKTRVELDERANAEAEVRRLNVELEERIAERTAQLAASEERYRLISTISSDYMFSTQLNPDGQLRLNWVAGAFETMTGYALEEYEAVGGWRIALHPEDEARDDRALAELHANQRVTSEVRTRTKNGDIRWVRVYAHPVWDATRQQLVGIYGAVQDITERQQAEAALRASEQRLRVLVEQLPAITYTDDVGRLGRTLYISPQLEALLGYAPTEWIDGELNFWLQHLHPADRDQALAEFEACFHFGTPVDSEYRMMAQDGREVWFHDRAVRLDQAGHPQLIQGVMMDITAQKRLESDLQAERDFALQIINTMGQGLTVTDADSRFVLVNPACARLVGCEQHELLGKGPADVTIPADQAQLRQAHTDRMAGKTTSYENHILRQDGSTIPVLITGTPRLKDGKYAGAIAVITDLTERKQAEEALTHERNLLQALMDNIPDTIYFKDLASRFTRINRAQARLLGLPTPDAAVGKTDLDFQTTSMAQTFYTEEQALMRTGQPITDRLEYNPTAEGHPRWLTATKVPVHDSAGRIIGLVGISRDITRRKLAEEREEQRRVMMEKVIDLGKAITQMTDLRQCLREIHQSVQKGLGFDRVGLFLLDVVTGELHGAFGTTTSGELEDTRWFTSSVTAHAAWQMALNDPKGLHLIEDYEAIHDLPADSGMRGVKQHVTLAAWAGEKPVALIAADNVITQRRITQEQLEALQLFAGYAGLAIQNARLFAETTEALVREQRLNEVARSLSSTLDLPTMLATITRLAAELVGAEAGIIGLIAPDDQTLPASYLLNMPDGFGLDQPIPRGQGVAWTIIESGQSVLVADYATHAKALPNWIRAGLHSYIGVPLVSVETRLGILGLYQFDATRRFSARELALAEAVGRQAGVAIQNARWHSELERRVAERTSELEVANRELESIAYTIAHDLRIPTRAMHGYAHILNETYAAQLDPEAQRHLQRIIENARYLGQLVDDLLSFMRLSRAPLHRQPVDMTEMAKHVVTRLMSKQPNRSVDLRVANLPGCDADPALLQEVWRQLIANALKFSATRAVLRLEIGASETEAGLAYSLRDNGVGFDMRYVHKLFGVFQRLHHLDEFEGTGMGLAIVQRILHRHGGRIWAEAEVDRGATFYFTLGTDPSKTDR